MRWRPGRRARMTSYSRGLERWLALGGADLDERAGAVVTGLGLTTDLDRAMTGLSGGQAARAGLASLLLSRYDVFLLDELDERPRPRRTGPARGVCPGTARRRRRRQPRPRVPHPNRHQDRRARPGSAAGPILRRRLRRLPRRTRGNEAARTCGPRGGRRHRHAWRNGPGPSALGWKGRRERPPQAARPRQTGPEVPHRGDREAGGEGEADRAPDRTARRRRGAPQGMGPPHGDRGRTEGGSDSRIDAGRRSPPWHVHARTWSICRSTGRTGSRSPAPNGSGKTTPPGGLLGRIPLAEGHAALGAGVIVGEVDQARGLFLGPEPLLDAFAAAVPDAPPPRSGPRSRSSACAPPTCSGPPRPSPPASAPGPRSRCCKRAASIYPRSTSRPITSTYPRSSSWSRRSMLPGHPPARHPRSPTTRRSDRRTVGST